MQDTVPNTVTKAPSPCHTALPSPGDKCHGLGIPTYISVNMHVVIGVSASSGYAVSICFTSLSDSFSNRVNDVDVSGCWNGSRSD